MSLVRRSEVKNFLFRTRFLWLTLFESAALSPVQKHTRSTALPSRRVLGRTSKAKHRPTRQHSRQQRRNKKTPATTITKRRSPIPTSLPPCLINSRRYWTTPRASARSCTTYTSRPWKKLGTAGRRIDLDSSHARVGKDLIAGLGPRKRAFAEDRV